MCDVTRETHTARGGGRGRWPRVWGVFWGGAGGGGVRVWVWVGRDGKGGTGVVEHVGCVGVLLKSTL